MDTYTTKLDMQAGTINICGGDTRFPILIDEWPALMESGQAEYERAKAIMGNPLLNAVGVGNAIDHYNHILHNGGESSSLKSLLEFYQNTLVMMKELESCLHMTANSIEAYDDGKFGGEYLNLLKWRDKLAAILEAHKQHMVE